MDISCPIPKSDTGKFTGILHAFPYGKYFESTRLSRIHESYKDPIFMPPTPR